MLSWLDKQKASRAMIFISNSKFSHQITFSFLLVEILRIFGAFSLQEIADVRVSGRPDN